ncbi:zinc-binding dehydrogenase [Companilactobacillus baiquanensis]|uniref:Zinc-binding dehydrogenase n=1 Tax=Companilactobacillus baiquanensis TaxID=2486005 RepID=A0ABW1UWJ8_9LACO|nr:zinc-binding dehydrogenase [Companilactobacillus baiquanensis]
MKALTIKENTDFGIENIQLIEMPTPKIIDNEILVKLHAVALNPVDYKLAEKHNSKWSYPHILGLDGAGEVIAVGENNPKQFKVGERVFFHNDLSKNGTFAEIAKAKSNVVTRIPDSVSYESAAAILCSGLTAYQAMYRKLSLSGKKTVLIHAGAGGVGGIDIQLAKNSGLTVITTVSKSKIPFAKKLGADFIIDYHNEDVDQVINKITKNLGVDLIINTVGGQTVQDDLNRLAYNGGIVTILNTPDITNYDLHAKGQSVLTLNLGGVHQSKNEAQLNDLAKMSDDLIQLVAKKIVDPMVNEIINFEDIPVGLEKIKQHKTMGKIVAKI